MKHFPDHLLFLSLRFLLLLHLHTDMLQLSHLHSMPKLSVHNFPVELLRIFSDSSEVIAIGKTAFPIIGSSFIPAVFSLMTAVFFQAIGNGRVSLFLSVMRQIFCLIPIFWALSLLGLQFTWFAFPISEVLVGVTGMGVYWRTINGWKNSRK